MRTVQKEVFLFSELSESAKEKAREWYLKGLDFDAECCIDDFKRACAFIGIDVDEVYYSGFWSQGDGASFTGSYSYAKGGLKALKAEFPEWTGFHEHAENLQEIQKRNFYKLRASISHHGNYQHSGCMSVDVHHVDDIYRDVGAAESDITDNLRWLADELYKTLENEYEYQTSDEAVDESLDVNGYEFTVDGEIY